MYEIRGSVVSVSFVFPHPPEDEKKKALLVFFFLGWVGLGLYDVRRFHMFLAQPYRIPRK